MMNRRLATVGVLFTASLFAGVMLVGAQTPQEQSNPNVKIKQVPVPNVSATSGKEMYNAYCAACHGTDGRGNGPAASALKTPPTNLTLLSAQHNGRFPEASVQQAIKGDPAMPSAHGSKGMPVWGPVFTMMGQGSEGQAQLRVRNLTQYILSLQRK
jgi:mono/diheme cytochrome c family protein